MTDQLIGFNDRIKKIKDPRNTYYVDPETKALVPKRVSRKSINQAAARRREKATFGGIMTSLLLGVVALMAARLVRWQVLGIQDGGSAADTLLLIDLGLAALIVFLVGGMIGQKTAKHMIAQTAGIGLALMSMHNLVWLMPNQFGQVYGQAYVDQVRATTEPNSIYLRGESIAVPLDAFA